MYLRFPSDAPPDDMRYRSFLGVGDLLLLPNQPTTPVFLFGLTHKNFDLLHEGTKNSRVQRGLFLGLHYDSKPPNWITTVRPLAHSLEKEIFPRECGQSLRKLNDQRTEQRAHNLVKVEDDEDFHERSG